MKIYRATRSQTQPDSSDSMTRAAAVWLCCVCVTWHTLQQPGYKINRHVQQPGYKMVIRHKGLVQKGLVQKGLGAKRIRRHKGLGAKRIRSKMD